MPANVTPNKIQNVVKRGFERMRSYRKARAMFIKEFAGQYYCDHKGVSGDEPLNLLFRTLSTFIPNLVMQNPVNEVTSEYLAYKPYAELLGLALNKVEADVHLKESLRAWIVSAWFAFGVMKISLASSENMIQYGDINIDPGQVYAKLVDLDDFVFDPICTNLKDSSFLGSRVRVPRQILLDTEGYDHDLVNKLPASKFFGGDRVEDLTKKHISVTEAYAMQDYVDVVESWIPEANAMVTMPDPMQLTTDKWLRTEDYYGPKEGPYVFLTFTPPVDDNPLPIAPVSVVYDLHRIANRVFKRMMDQADNQKDVLAYDPAFADDAQDIVNAEDGDTIAMSNPESAKIISYGGANSKNEQMATQMQMWFNYMAGNPDQVAGNMTRGTKGTKETATKTAAMQSNATVTLDDARGIIYDGASEISKRMAWYLHNDPLINMPLTKRTTGNQYQQLTLTPDHRMGDFFDFAFNIRSRSMVPLDPATRARLMVEFAVNMTPAIINAGMVAMQMGVPFNVQRCLTDLAEQQGLTADVMSWFDDPEFRQKMETMRQMGPQNPGKAGQAGPGSTEQNGGSPITRSVATPDQQFNKNAQVGSAGAQAAYGG